MDITSLQSGTRIAFDYPDHACNTRERRELTLERVRTCKNGKTTLVGKIPSGEWRQFDTTWVDNLVVLH